MFRSDLKLLAPTLVQGSKYTGLSYANDTTCRRCNSVHAVLNKILPETDKTELMVSRIASQAAVTQGGVMLGVLIANNGNTAVAVSGDSAAKAQRVTLAAAGLYPNVVVAPDLAEFHINTRQNNNITLFEQGYCHTPGDHSVATPGNCAAPKLVGWAIAQAWPLPYVMSEAWSRSQQAAGFKYGQSEPIESCNTCCKLLPMMMCTGVAG
jgi:hypothetical protein